MSAQNDKINAEETQDTVDSFYSCFENSSIYMRMFSIVPQKGDRVPNFNTFCLEESMHYTIM